MDLKCLNRCIGLYALLANAFNRVQTYTLYARKRIVLIFNSADIVRSYSIENIRGEHTSWLVNKMGFHLFCAAVGFVFF